MRHDSFKKGVLSLILVFSILLSVFSTAVFAVEETAIRFGTVYCTTGGEISVPVIIENNAGLAGFRLYVNYDADLDFLDVQKASAFSSGTFVSQNNTAKGRVCLIWYHTEAVSANGKLFTLRFKTQNAFKENYLLSFTYLPEDILREDASPLPINTIGESVEITHTYTAWDQNEETHCKKCSVCGKVDDSSCEKHDYTDNCDPYCNSCGYQRQITHDYSTLLNSEFLHWYNCSVCGATQDTSYEEHVYDHTCDTVCNVCERERTITHSYSVQDKNATEHWMKCSICGGMDEDSRETHKYDNACDTTCEECGYVRQVSDHVYDDNRDAICNECGFERTLYIPGDMDNDGDVDLNDAIYLLYHVNFPSIYPITQPGDVDGSGEVDLNDAIYLLYHVNFPSNYPLH